jgi:hypothetical protein
MAGLRFTGGPTCTQPWRSKYSGIMPSNKYGVKGGFSIEKPSSASSVAGIPIRDESASARAEILSGGRDTRRVGPATGK